MNDKILDLLEKVYIELQETKIEVKESNKRIMAIESDIAKSGNQMTKLEAKFHDNFGILSDEFALFKNDLQLIKSKVNTVEERVNRHELNIKMFDPYKNKEIL